MSNIRTQDPDLVRPFSLYVFHGLLSAVHTMHQKGWTHRDLHGNFLSHLVVYYICFDLVLM
jgi:hypothetical protein